MSVVAGDRIFSKDRIKEIAIELKGLGCPVWKIAKLLSISEQKVVEYAGIEERY